MVTFRRIVPEDNRELASIIRKSLEAYGLNIPGTVYTDPSTDDLFELFRTPGSVYFVALSGDRILGGCGIYPTKNLPQGYAELVKLYLREEERGKGIGKMLMEKCITWALEEGYQSVYLETFAELSSAVGLYQSLGFRSLPHSLGESGHDACQVWMALDLFRVTDFDHMSREYQKALFIRKKVFIEEQKIDQALELEHESECRYFLVYAGTTPASTARLRLVNEKIKVERFATLKERRGLGAGKVLIRAMIEHARKYHPEKKLFMHAQLSAAGFYEKNGWKAEGGIFYEAGIPHIAMIY